MLKFVFCLPTVGKTVPAGPQWLHEIKMDGYRVRLERDGDLVRLITKSGYNWSKRYPWIVENALKNRQKHFVIDGEAIVRGVDGYSDFNALHSGRDNAAVEMVAFEILARRPRRADLAPRASNTRLQANLCCTRPRRRRALSASDHEWSRGQSDLHLSDVRPA
ncbi:ATP-dependent DNA ligase [Bradyrhizobium sp. USDA 3240]